MHFLDLSLGMKFLRMHDRCTTKVILNLFSTNGLSNLIWKELWVFWSLIKSKINTTSSRIRKGPQYFGASYEMRFHHEVLIGRKTYRPNSVSNAKCFTFCTLCHLFISLIIFEIAVTMRVFIFLTIRRRNSKIVP